MANPNPAATPGAADQPEFDVSRGGARAILLVCTLLYIVNFMDRQVFAAVLEPMKQELGLSDRTAGFLQTAFLLSMAAFSFPAAFLVDRWSRRKGIALMAVVWSLFTALTGLGRGFGSLLAARIGVGVGEAAFASGGMAWIGAAYPKSRRAKVMGLFNSAVALGSALGFIIGGALSKKFGWRAPFFLFAAPGVVLGLVALWLKDYRTVHEVDAAGRRVGFLAGARSLLRIRTLRWLYLGFGLQNILAFGFLAWTPAYLMRALNITEDEAGWRVGVIGLMAVLGSVLGGWIADVWQEHNPRGRMLTPALFILITTLLYVVVVQLQYQGLGRVLALVFGMTLAAGMPAVSAVSQDVVGPALKGASWGMNVFCMYVLGGGWAPWLVGEVSDRLGGGARGLQLALLATAVGGVLASVCFYLSARSYPEDQALVREFTLTKETSA